jgi:uncharacterized protein YuzE
MIVRYDRTVDAAYIYLVSPASSPPVDRTVPVDPLEAGAEINLDFDGAGRLVGIEVLGASIHLPQTILDDAEII